MFPVAKPVVVDLGFIFGAAGYNADQKFESAKELAKRMVNDLYVSPNAALIGGIIYDDGARMLWRLGDTKDSSSTIYNIERIVLSRRGNNLRKAFEVARDELFALSNGARRNVPKTLVVFIDKTPRDPGLSAVAKELKTAGVKIVVVALGSEVDPTDIKELPSSEKALLRALDLSKMMNESLPSALLQSKPGMPMNFYLIFT